MFDALNRKTANEGVTLSSKDYKILQSSLEWLDAWERLVEENKLSKDEFLTDVTAQNLRLSLHSTLDLCNYMINNYDFQYLLTGKVNQDNLEKFFGTIRQAAGCNDHPTSAIFLSLYKILSTYSVLKPPRAGNCTVNKKENLKTLITMEDLKDLLNSKTSTYSDSLKSLKEKLDKVIDQDDWEVDDVLFDDHDYFRAEVLECIIYYTTGFLHNFFFLLLLSLFRKQEYLKLYTYITFLMFINKIYMFNYRKF